MTGISKQRRAEKVGESEYQAQCAVIKWAAVMEQRHPELKLLKSNLEGIFLGGSKKHRAITVAKQKAAGMRPGWPDLELPVGKLGFLGLFIELKVGKNKPSPNQIEYLDALRGAGNAVYVAYGSAQAIRIISSYLDIK